MPDTVYGKLIKDESVPVDAYKLTNARKPSITFFTTYVGLNRDYKDLGIKDYSVFLFDSSNTKSQDESCNNIDTSYIIANCLNVLNPNASEPNTSIMYFTTVVKEEAWKDFSEEEYIKIKNRVAKRMIETHEIKVGVETMPYIEEIVTSGPPTFERYLNTPNGTPYSIFICGPEQMHNYLDNELSKLDIEKKYIRHEVIGSNLFNLDKKLVQITVIQNGESKVITASTNDTVLQSLEKNGIKTLSRCRRGECGFCHSRLISGDVHISLKQDRRRKADEIYGYLHPCYTYPLINIVIEIPN